MEIFIILSLISIYLCNAQDDFIILTPHRPIDIQWNYPHFLNYYGMMHMGVRGSQYGFFNQYRYNFFPERLMFLSYDLIVDFKKHVLNKNGYQRYKILYSFMKNPNLKDVPYGNRLLFQHWMKSKVFKQEMKKKLPNDFTLPWQLYFLWITASLYYHPVDKLHVEGSMTHHDLMVANYIYLVCTQLREQGKDDLICPDPCRKRPCADVPNVATELCYRKNFGLFLTDYYCICQEGFKWNMFEKRCVQFNLCSLPNTCNKKGTARCIYIPSRLESFCECKMGYMGARCSIIRNPCIETSNNLPMSGNMYCNIGQGNVCVGSLGSDRFECVCTPSWTQDLNLPTVSNCLAFRDLCSSAICQSGDCISSRDGQTIVCICPPELTGRDCNLRRSLWSRWLPWSQCDPLCGPVRRSVRLRFCDGDDCVGERRQVRLCRPTYCGGQPMFEYASSYRWKQTFFIMYTYVFLLANICIFCSFIGTLMVAFAVFPGLSTRISSFLPKAEKL